MRRKCGGARLANIGGDGFRHFEIKIGRLQNKLAVGRLQKHVGEDRDCVTAFDDAVHVAQRFEKRCSFESDFHGA